jgi:hypothetical protein
MTRDDVGLVAAVVLAGGLILIAISALAGCSASLPYGRPGLALHDYIEAHIND